MEAIVGLIILYQTLSNSIKLCHCVVFRNHLPWIVGCLLLELSKLKLKVASIIFGIWERKRL